ncbi:MAG: prolyl oligopeptidase family serine peptidase [Candidatus Acidiferrales bacterium]
MMRKAAWVSALAAAARSVTVRAAAAIAGVMCATMLCAAIITSEAKAQDKTKKLTLETYFEMETVSSPQISPDGRQIVYTRGWVDKVNDRRQSSLWVMNADGTRNRFLCEGSSPRWSPDGTRIAYLSDGEPQGRQIFVRWMDDGSTSQITRVDETPSGIQWAPDGESMAFTMMAPKRESWGIRMPSRPEGAKWTESPRIIERLQYRQDRVGFLEQGYRHIFTAPAGGGTPRQITSGDYNHGGAGFGGGSFSWTPDGKEILFSSLRENEWEHQWRESEVYAVNVASGTVRQLTRRTGPDGNPEVSPDGKWVAYTGYDMTDDTYRDQDLYVMGIDGSNPRILTAKFERSPSDLTWAPDSSGIYFSADDSGADNLHFASLEGEIRQVTKGTHMLSLGSVNKSGHAAVTVSSFHEPGDVYTFSLTQPQLKRLTFVNADVLGDVKLGEVEEIWYTSLDNFRIQGWLIKPPDFDPKKKYPLMLSIHGGPHAMYNVAFNFGWQEHAANGYLVLYTNPRGSTGYGSAFGNAIKYAYPSKDYDDLMKGVDEVIAKGNVDARNMFVYGCSGGGVLTAWIVGHTDRFAAASSNCPVINWISFVGNVDGNHLRWYNNFAKYPWEDPTEHLRRSPLMYVGNVKTPTMLMTGVLDMRTPISQTEEFYQALKTRKVPTAMVRFNGEYHGTTSRPSNFLRTQLYLRYWFEKFTTKDAPQQKAGGEQ